VGEQCAHAAAEVQHPAGSFERHGPKEHPAEWLEHRCPQLAIGVGFRRIVPGQLGARVVGTISRVHPPGG